MKLYYKKTILQECLIAEGYSNGRLIFFMVGSLFSGKSLIKRLEKVKLWQR